MEINSVVKVKTSVPHANNATLVLTFTDDGFYVFIKGNDE